MPRNGSIQNSFYCLLNVRRNCFSCGIYNTISWFDSKKFHVNFCFQKNQLILERLVCPPSKPESIAKSWHCIFKYISRSDLKIEFRFNLTKPLNDFWVHSTFYFKFNGITFQKFPIDLTENICDWLSGKGKSYIMDWSVSKVIKYSNVNHICPWLNPVLMKVDNISMHVFSFEQSFLPAGNYRVDNDFTEGREGALHFLVHHCILVSLTTD